MFDPVGGMDAIASAPLDAFSGVTVHLGRTVSVVRTTADGVEVIAMDAAGGEHRFTGDLNRALPPHLAARLESDLDPVVVAALRDPQPVTTGKIGSGVRRARSGRPATASSAGSRTAIRRSATSGTRRPATWVRVGCWSCAIRSAAGRGPVQPAARTRGVWSCACSSGAGHPRRAVPPDRAEVVVLGGLGDAGALPGGVARASGASSN